MWAVRGFVPSMTITQSPVVVCWWSTPAKSGPMVETGPWKQMILTTTTTTTCIWIELTVWKAFTAVFFPLLRPWVIGSVEKSQMTKLACTPSFLMSISPALQSASAASKRVMFSCCRISGHALDWKHAEFVGVSAKISAPFQSASFTSLPHETLLISAWDDSVFWSSEAHAVTKQKWLEDGTEYPISNYIVIFI